MGTTTTDNPARAFRCTCGRTLGTIARDPHGPVSLTPVPDATFVGVTGVIVWLRCSCGVESPWFVMPWRGTRPTPHSAL